jgi:kynurenine 3-monooxygenase
MRISNLSVSVDSGVARASATVTWEDTDRPPLNLFVDVEERFQNALRADPNAFLMTCLVPAWHFGESRIAIEGALCPLQHRNLRVVFAKLSRWFRDEFKQPPRIEAERGFELREPAGASLAMLSCGIDSLATLRWNMLNVPRHHSRAIKAVAHTAYHSDPTQSLELLQIAAAPRLSAVQNVAADAGADVISVRTNSWELADDGYLFSLKFHGAAFASIGAMMSGLFQRVYVAAGQDPWVDEPWGSHPMLDPYYSTAYFAVEHDLIMSRLDKTRLVADWQVALDNLRVCQNLTDGEANCGTCEKCIRTTLMLLTIGRLTSKALLTEVEPWLIQLLDDYQMISPLEGFIDYYDNMVPGLKACGRDDLADALAKVLRATRARHEHVTATATTSAPAVRMVDTPDIAIVGCGPVGALLALMMARRGHTVDVYEGRPDPRVRALPAGRSINLTVAERGWRALRKAGVESEVRQSAIPLYGRLIHSGTESRFQPYTVNGDAIYSASRSWLATLLTDIAGRTSNIRLHFNHRCRDVDVPRRFLSIETPSGSVQYVSPKVVFAADGAFSAVRRSLVRRGLVTFSNRLSPLMYKELQLSAGGDGLAALENNVLHLWPGGDRMTVAFPNLDQSFTFSLFMPAQGEPSFGALTSREELHQFLLRTCPVLAPKTDDLVHDFFAGPPAPMTSGHVRPWAFDSWLTLVGDAAHTLEPFLGQGLNAGFEDCSVLDELMEQHGTEWSAVLSEFERSRADNCDAITRLAGQHFTELALAAKDPSFLVRKALENKAHRLAPDHFVPVYTRVAFLCEPYAEVERVKARQEAILDRLMAIPNIAGRWDEPDVEAILRAELRAIEKTQVSRLPA